VGGDEEPRELAWHAGTALDTSALGEMLGRCVTEGDIGAALREAIGAGLDISAAVSEVVQASRGERWVCPRK
jgi:hypothetical protein